MLPTEANTLQPAPGLTTSLVKSWITALYALILVTAFLVNATQHWTAEQLSGFMQWSLLFLSPALWMWLAQSMRRRQAIRDTGVLVEKFPAQHTGTFPRWLAAVLFALAATGPFVLFSFSPTEVMGATVTAFAGVLLFALAWLRFDGLPLEVRQGGLIVDGNQVFRYDRIGRVRPDRRSNQIELECDGRATRVFVSPEDRGRLLELIEQGRANPAP